MPEGHKTHYLARQHQRWLADYPLKVTSPQGRFGSDARRISGRIVDSVMAVGKHLFYGFDGGLILHIHLGRYGKFRQHPVPPPPPVGQVRARLIGRDVALDLTGPTTCRVINDDIRRKVMQRLGPDPLAGGRAADVWEKISASRKPIAALLLDQSVIAGVGNIFRAEVLFETEVDPRTPGNELSKHDFERIWKSLSKMMRRGLRYGRIISVSAKEAGKPLGKLEGKERFRVYGKQQCPRCDDQISTIDIGSRRLYLCASCQQ